MRKSLENATFNVKLAQRFVCPAPPPRFALPACGRDRSRQFFARIETREPERVARRVGTLLCPRGFSYRALRGQTMKLFAHPKKT